MEVIIENNIDRLDDSEMRIGSGSHTKRSHRHHHTWLQIMCNALPYQLIPNHTIYHHTIAIPYISTIIPADGRMIPSIMCTLNSTAIDNGLVGSGKDRVGRHVRAHSTLKCTCSTYLWVSLNSARCTSAIAGLRGGGY